MTDNSFQHDAKVQASEIHPAIKEALQFLLDEAYRYGDADMVRILSDALVELEDAKKDQSDVACKDDLNQVITFIKMFFSLEQDKRDSFIHSLGLEK